MISDVDKPQRPQWRSMLHEIDLFDLLRDVWGARRTILALLGAAVLWSVFSVWTAKPVYTSTMLVGPAEQGGQRDLGGALNRVAGAASALGLGGLGTFDTSLFSKYGSVLDSYELAAAVLRHDELKPMLFGPSWHPKTRTFERPSGVLFEIKDFAKGLLGLPKWAPPGPVSMRGKLKSLIHLTPDKVKGYLNISADGDTPQEAIALLNVVYKEADELLRYAAKERSRSRIDYLNNALQHTTLQDQRTAIIDVLSMQEQRMMMASADKTMAVEVIDAPIVDPVPSSPKPRAVLLVNVLLAIALGCLTAVILGVRQRNAARLDAARGEAPVTIWPADTVVAWYLHRFLDRIGLSRRGKQQSYARSSESGVELP